MAMINLTPKAEHVDRWKRGMDVRSFSTLIALALLACSGGTPSTPTAAPAQVPASDPAAPSVPEATPGEISVLELSLDQTVSVGELRLRWIDLNDSRCPVGVTCFWEGQAVATLEVSREDLRPQRVELFLRAGVEDGAEAVADVVHEMSQLGTVTYVAANIGDAEAREHLVAETLGAVVGRMAVEAAAHRALAG